METFALVCLAVCVGVELYQDVLKSPPPRDNKAVEILAGLAGTTPQWGTADAKIKNPPGGSQGLSKVPSF